MRQLVISDATMKQTFEDMRLNFKEKIELAKLLDKLGANIIELDGIKDPRVDSLLIKSIVAAIKNSDEKKAAEAEKAKAEAAKAAAQATAASVKAKEAA